MMAVFVKGVDLSDNGQALDAIREQPARPALPRLGAHAGQLRARLLPQHHRRQLELRAVDRGRRPRRRAAGERDLEAAPRRLRAAADRRGDRRGAAGVRRPAQGRASRRVRVSARLSCGHRSIPASAGIGAPVRGSGCRARPSCDGAALASGPTSATIGSRVGTAAPARDRRSPSASRRGARATCRSTRRRCGHRRRRRARRSGPSARACPSTRSPCPRSGARRSCPCRSSPPAGSAAVICSSDTRMSGAPTPQLAP